MNFFKNSLAALCLSLPLLLTAAPAQGPLATTQGVIDGLIQAIDPQLAELKKDQSKLLDLLSTHLLPHADQDAMARKVVGKYWKTATDDQKQRFTTAFRKSLLRYTARAFSNYDGQKIQYLPEPEYSTTALIKTKIIQTAGKPIAVDYKVIQKDDQWLVNDIVIEGISLITSKNKEFAPIIAKSGMDGLIEQLNDKNQQSLQ